MILSSAIEDHSSEELQRSSSSGEMPVTPHIKPGKKRRRGSEVDDVILENLRQLQERREIERSNNKIWMKKIIFHVKLLLYFVVCQFRNDHAQKLKSSKCSMSLSSLKNHHHLLKNKK